MPDSDSGIMFWPSIVLVAATVVLVTLLTSLLLLHLARRYKIYPAIRDRDVHTRPTPRLGGVAMYLGLLAGLGVASLIPDLHAALYGNGERQVVSLLLAVTLIVVMGVVDDLFDLAWYFKLPVEALAAVVVAIPGALRFEQAPTGALTVAIVGYWPSIIITVLVILVTVNMVNFIDGLDGLVAGIAIIANSAYLLYCYTILAATGQSGQIMEAIMLTTIMGSACLGFLPVNWRPARMFMGDAGSMQIGLVFAVTAIIVSQAVDPSQVFQINDTGQYNRASLAPAFLPILLPLAVMIVPLADFILAITRRLLAGKSPFTADRKHLHHRLLDMGHTPLHATLIFYALTLVISGGSLLFLFSTRPVAWGVIGGGLVLVAVITLLPLSKRKQVEVKVQTTPITVITPEMLAMDPLERRDKK